ncbi:MAG: cation transporter [Desulfomonile sp.]|jgi:divalent metal cation (Fe/Co/Zn/Cd) transporter
MFAGLSRLRLRKQEAKYLSAKPPDESHPYGHGKIEYFSAGFEGALIIVAAVGIFVVGLRQIIDPQEPNWSVMPVSD